MRQKNFTSRQSSRISFQDEYHLLKATVRTYVFLIESQMYWGWLQLGFNHVGCRIWDGWFCSVIWRVVEMLRHLTGQRNLKAMDRNSNMINKDCYPYNIWKARLAYLILVMKQSQVLLPLESRGGCTITPRQLNWLFILPEFWCDCVMWKIEFGILISLWINILAVILGMFPMPHTTMWDCESKDSDHRRKPSLESLLGVHPVRCSV